MPLSVGPPGTIVPAPGVGVPGPVVGVETATQEFPTACGKNGVVRSQGSITIFGPVITIQRPDTIAIIGFPVSDKIIINSKDRDRDIVCGRIQGDILVEVRADDDTGSIKIIMQCIIQQALWDNCSCLH